MRWFGVADSSLRLRIPAPRDAAPWARAGSRRGPAGLLRRRFRINGLGPKAGRSLPPPAARGRGGRGPACVTSLGDGCRGRINQWAGPEASWIPDV
jgi:hypothetical protein